MENISLGRTIYSDFQMTNIEMTSISFNYNYYDNISEYEIFDIPFLKQPTHLVVLYVVAYCVVFLLGLIGNSLVMAVIIKDPEMRNVTNYFILNMAVADMLVTLLCVPTILLANIITGKLNVLFFRPADFISTSPFTFMCIALSKQSFIEINKYSLIIILYI
jgi:hypothetical protein